MYWIAWVSSCLATLLRFGAGLRNSRPGQADLMPIILYEFEGCPFCKIARESASASGLTIEMRPCPKKGERFRPELVERGGKAQFPYMIDPNTGTEMYESADISSYFRETYGGRRPLIHWLGPLGVMLASYSILMRGMAGVGRQARQSSETLDPSALVLKGGEWNPSVRLAKEALCSKEISYIWQSDHSGRPELALAGQEPISGGAAISAFIKSL